MWLTNIFIITRGLEKVSLRYLKEGGAVIAARPCRAGRFWLGWEGIMGGMGWDVIRARP